MVKTKLNDKAAKPYLVIHSVWDLTSFLGGNEWAICQSTQKILLFIISADIICLHACNKYLKFLFNNMTFSFQMAFILSCLLPQIKFKLPVKLNNLGPDLKYSKNSGNIYLISLITFNVSLLPASNNIPFLTVVCSSYLMVSVYSKKVSIPKLYILLWDKYNLTAL